MHQAHHQTPLSHQWQARCQHSHPHLHLNPRYDLARRICTTHHRQHQSCRCRARMTARPQGHCCEERGEHVFCRERGKYFIHNHTRTYIIPVCGNIDFCGDIKQKRFVKSRVLQKQNQEEQRVSYKIGIVPTCKSEKSALISTV